MMDDPTAKSQRQSRLKVRAESSIAATRVIQLQAENDTFSRSKILWRLVGITVSVLIVSLKFSILMVAGLCGIGIISGTLWVAEHKQILYNQRLLYELTREPENKYVDDLDGRYVNYRYEIMSQISFRAPQMLLRYEGLIWVYLQVTLGIVSALAHKSGSNIWLS